MFCVASIHQKVFILSKGVFLKVSVGLEGNNHMIIAEISVVPLGEGTSVSGFVRLAIEELRKSGLKTLSGPMSTSVEASNLDEILGAAKAAHEAVLKAGARRVITTLKIDDRRDKAATMDTKMKAIEH